MAKIKVTSKKFKVKGAKTITAGDIARKFRTPQQKYTAERLFVKAQKLLAKWGKPPKRVKYTHKKKQRKIPKKLPTSLQDSKPVAVFKKVFRQPISNALVAYQMIGFDAFTRTYLQSSRKSPNDVIWIKLSSKGEMYLSNFKSYPKLYRQVLNDVAYQMRVIRSSMSAYAAAEIARYVPRDTGNLRWSLLTSLNESVSTVPKISPKKNEDIELRMGLFSDLPYLEYVDKPKKPIKVRHSKSEKIRSRKTGEYLHDPHALTGFMSLVTMHLKSRARILTRTMLSALAGRWGMKYNEIKSLFSYKNYNFR